MKRTTRLSILFGNGGRFGIWVYGSQGNGVPDTELAEVSCSGFKVQGSGFSAWVFKVFSLGFGGFEFWIYFELWILDFELPWDLGLVT